MHCSAYVNQAPLKGTQMLETHQLPLGLRQGHIDYLVNASFAETQHAFKKENTVCPCSPFSDKLWESNPIEAFHSQASAAICF